MSVFGINSFKARILRFAEQVSLAGGHQGRVPRNWRTSTPSLQMTCGREQRPRGCVLYGIDSGWVLKGPIKEIKKSFHDYALSSDKIVAHLE
ncbi:hypothetical protein TNCV_1399741 [Trichonephila clavipes]|nr:hypothetical protein TNCV_1399741 [Trichonephila clavipes]